MAVIVEKPITTETQSLNFKVLIQNMVAALTVSFVAISLGAAFGILSERGAFVGMMSAGVIAFYYVGAGRHTRTVFRADRAHDRRDRLKRQTRKLGRHYHAGCGAMAVLMIKEKAALRLSDIMVGVLVIIEIILFQDAISLIPQAVFAGVLIKVGSNPTRLP